MKGEALNLGRLLVDELGLESSVDTLSRWMAHYIAEQMQLIESTHGEEQKLAEKRCFETILKVWKHMRYYNANTRPFENFEPIFRTLNRLDPDNENTYYFQNEYSRKNISSEDEITQYMLLATSIDETARVWLEFIFQSAAELAADAKTKEWIETALPLEDNSEASLIVRILSNYEFDELEDDGDKRIKKLNSRIEKLEDFQDFSNELILMYKREIDILKQN